MSLFGILNNAASSLLNAQTQIGVVSTNINNSQSPNYVRRTATVVSQSPAAGGGASVVDVSRAVNDAMQSDFLNQTTTASKTSYVNTVYQQLESLDGSAGGTPVLSNAMQQFISAYNDFQAEPESTVTQAAVVNAAQNLAGTVSTLSTGIENIATSVQQQATSDVSSLNTDLTTIAQINNQIVSLQASGQDTSSLSDARDAALADAATYVPLRTTNNADGSINVATPDGVALVNGGLATQFAYNATTNTVTIASDPTNTSYNAAFSNGKISGELDTLSTTVNPQTPGTAPLERMREQLNAFVDQFYAAPPATPTAFQAAYNSATPLQTGEQDTDLFTITGTPPSNQDRFNLQVNPNITNGTATVKQSSATPVLTALTASTQNFSAGGLTLANQSFLTIANTIASTQTTQAQLAQAASQQATTSLAASTTQYQNATGVSVDSELAKLIVLQNSYNASAKLISTVNQMAQALFNAVS